MQVSFSASGQPRAVIQSINDQAQKARKAEGAESHAASIMALRDQVLADIRDVGEDDTVTVSASMSITTTVTKAEPVIPITEVTSVSSPATPVVEDSTVVRRPGRRTTDR